MNDDFVYGRVPCAQRSSLFTVTLIRIGSITALSQFMLGATLGHAMSFWQAILATLLGSLILEFVGLGLGLAGVREGLPTSLLSRWCGFGRFGSALIGLAIGISSLGWFGVQNGVFAKSLAYAFDGKLSFAWCAVIAGLATTLLVAFGYRALGWTARIAVPLFILMVMWGAYQVLPGLSPAELFGYSRESATAISLSAGATMVAGGYIVAALITPDISRYCKDGKSVFWMMTISIIVGEFIVNALSILIAHVLDTEDVVSIMTQSAGWLGAASVMLAVVKVNDINLYSVSLGVSNFIHVWSGLRIKYSIITLVAGSLGTFFTVTGILHRFIDFLMMVGVVFPPIAGIMLVDYYLLKTHRAVLDASRQEGTLPDNASTPFINLVALFSWGIGAVSGFVITEGIPALNAIAIAGVLYWVLSYFKQICVKRVS
ncbi:purine-cytosine permease family protein [Sodalis sp.]|uniref:purine-cytosine permease family protein n=1 Tax=Sodalis sp. (in: enterobacteria) TaxID=1898979 RepID=UPI003873749E